MSDLLLVGSYGKESACSAEDPGLIPGSGRTLQEKEMATHSSILVWKIPWSLVSYSLWGHKELDTTEPTTLVIFINEAGDDDGIGWEGPRGERGVLFLVGV